MSLVGLHRGSALQGYQVLSTETLLCLEDVKNTFPKVKDIDSLLQHLLMLKICLT